jgi:hypothetical protein
MGFRVQSTSFIIDCIPHPTKSTKPTLSDPLLDKPFVLRRMFICFGIASEGATGLTTESTGVQRVEDNLTQESCRLRNHFVKFGSSENKFKAGSLSRIGQWLMTFLSQAGRGLLALLCFP